MRMVHGCTYLRQLDGLADNVLLLVVVANLHVAGEGEVLAEGMALEAVVGKDAAQIGVALEVDPEEIPHLALIPVRRIEHGHRGVHRRQLVAVRLDTDAGVVGYREEVVHNLREIRQGSRKEARGQQRRDISPRNKKQTNKQTKIQ